MFIVKIIKLIIAIFNSIVDRILLEPNYLYSFFQFIFIAPKSAIIRLTFILKFFILVRVIIFIRLGLIMYVIESCTENFSESLIAYKNGATRIELCENLSIGGVTPSYGNIKLCVDKLPIPTFVMIRPRGGNFVYNEDDINIMLHDINVCVSLGVAGVVFGCLKDDNTINYPLMEKLIRECRALEIITHRAFDHVKDLHLEIQKLKNIGIHHILSAGGLSTAFDGKDNLLKILTECKKHSVKLTVAGKITSSNLSEVSALIPADAYHGRSIVKYID